MLQDEQDSREIIRSLTKAKAALLWHAMDSNQKTGIRFGMFPAEVIRAAEAEGFNGRELCVALMDCANRNGGMIA